MNFKDQPRWVLWREHEGKTPWGINGRPGLIDAQPGTLAQVDALWARLPSAYAGRGYAPTMDDSLACLDFDNLTHRLLPELLTFSYCERSPTKRGMHVLVTLRPYAKQRLKGIHKMDGFELISDSGFFTVTFDALNELPIADASEHLVGLANRFNLYAPNGAAHPAPSCLLPIDFLRSMLKAVNPDCPYPDWFQALAAIHYATDGSNEGKALAHEWSSQGTKYDPDYIERNWHKFDDSKCRYPPATTLQILQRTLTRGVS